MFTPGVHSVDPIDCQKPAAFLVRYADGLKGTVLHLDGMVQEFAYAARRKDGHVDAVMNSRHEDHRIIDTRAELGEICYQSYDEMPFSPRGERPTGASIDPLAPDIA